MTKKIDKAEFIARLDGTLEEKIYTAYYHGFEKGFDTAKSPHDSSYAANWQINVAYSDWQRWLMDGCPKDEEVEK